MTIGFDLGHDIDLNCEGWRWNLLYVSQKMVQLPLNEKHKYQLNNTKFVERYAWSWDSLTALECFMNNGSHILWGLEYWLTCHVKICMIQAWLLIDWQYSHQPTRSHVKILTNTDFDMTSSCWFLCPLQGSLSKVEWDLVLNIKFRTLRSNHIHLKQWDMITCQWFKFDVDLTKLSSKSGYG